MIRARSTLTTPVANTRKPHTCQRTPGSIVVDVDREADNTESPNQHLRRSTRKTLNKYATPLVPTMLRQATIAGVFRTANGGQVDNDTPTKKRQLPAQHSDWEDEEDPSIDVEASTMTRNFLVYHRRNRAPQTPKNRKIIVATKHEVGDAATASTSHIWQYFKTEPVENKKRGRNAKGVYPKGHRCIVVDGKTGLVCGHIQNLSGGKPAHSNMWRHLEMYHSIQNVKTFANRHTSTKNLEKMGPDDLLKLLVYFFTTGGIPILQIENAYFIRFVEILVSLAPGCDFQLPRRTRFTTEVCRELDIVKKQVKHDIQAAPGKVSFAFDCWASTNNLPFMTVTGHYIDKDWVLQRQLVSFNKFSPPHTGDRIGEKLFNIIATESGLNCKNKLLGICGDSASSNLLGVHQLEAKLSKDAKRNDDLQSWPALENFFNCASHVINLVAKDVCAPFISKVQVDGNEVEVDAYTAENTQFCTSKKGIMVSALAKLGGAAKKRNQSHAFLSSWEAAAAKQGVTPLKLIKAAPTRWNSRYNQIDVALKMRPVYDEVTSQPGYKHFQLAPSEWDHLRWLHGILKVLNRASQKLSSSKEVTISEMLPLFNQIFDMLEDELASTTLVSEHGGDNQYEAQQRKLGLKAAREKLAKYYAYTATNPLYTFGLILDPRFGWNFITSDPSWDDPSEDDLDSDSELEEMNIRHAAAVRRKRHAELYATDSCKYQDEDIQEKYGIDSTSRDATRNTWKMKFAQCWREYRDKYFPDVQDDTVVELKTAVTYYLDMKRSGSMASKNRKSSSSISRGCQKSRVSLVIPTEVERFFHHNATIEINQCPLAWWKANEKAYPVCAAMARDILAIPVSAAEPERIHSQARTVLDWNQARMGPLTVEASVMVKCSVLYNPSTTYGHLDAPQLAKLYDPEKAFNVTI